MTFSKRLAACIVLLSSMQIALVAQSSSNDFKVGLMGVNTKQSCIMWTYGINYPPVWPSNNSNNIVSPLHTRLDAHGNKTSIMNVLVEDGFNIVHTYSPEGDTEHHFEAFVLCAKDNGLQVLPSVKNFYLPLGGYELNTSIYQHTYGINVLDMCGNSVNYYSYPSTGNFQRPNYIDYFNGIFTNPAYENTLWGFQVTEEACQNQWFATSPNQDCRPAPAFYGDSAVEVKTEVPLQNVEDAVADFANLKLPSQQLVLMESHHGKMIGPNNNDQFGVYSADDYLGIPGGFVFFEGSYGGVPGNNGWLWQTYSDMFNNGWHYLGKFKSIDRAKSFDRKVHSVIGDFTYDYGHTPYEQCLELFHSNINIKNANFIWFQAYTSIIHGAEGIWFWDATQIWGNPEIDEYEEDVVNRPYMANDGYPNAQGEGGRYDRFEREYFPLNYKRYLAPLARELRWLVNEDILSTDPNSVVATKTDHPDEHCILPAASVYLNQYASSDPELSVAGQAEKYGLRYTIRTNGDETFMIITNPYNKEVSTSLNFSEASDQNIQNAVGVQHYFVNASSNLPVTSNAYKLDRTSNLTFDFENGENGLTQGYYYQAMSGGGLLPITMGPMDTKVFKFVGSQTTSEDNWTQEWSNFGTGSLNWDEESPLKQKVELMDDDAMYAGDFDGDGDEELLLISPTRTASKSVIADYRGDGWFNYGFVNPISQPFEKVYVGDFDGDGRDDFFVHTSSSGDMDYYVRNLSFQTSYTFYLTNKEVMDFNVTTSSNKLLPQHYQDGVYVGDFDGDGKDELFMFNLTSNASALFKWSSGGYFYRIWADETGSHALKDGLVSDMKVADFDGDGKDELLSLHSWAVLYHYDYGNFNWGYSTYGGNSIGGWTYPPASDDFVLAGNLDGDAKEELMFIQGSVYGVFAATMDMRQDQSQWDSHFWASNVNGNIPYINSWPIPMYNGSNTDYLAIKPVANRPHMLLARRKFCSSYLMNMYAPETGYNFKQGESNSSTSEDEQLVQSSDLKEVKVLSLYPNPSSKQVYLETQGEEGVEEVWILGVGGDQLRSFSFNGEKHCTLNIEHLSAGFVFVKVKLSSGKIEAHKLAIAGL